MKGGENMSLFSKKVKSPPVSPDEIRKQKVALLETATGSKRIAETVGNNDLVDRAIENLKKGNFELGLKILRVPVNDQTLKAAADVALKL